MNSFKDVNKYDGLLPYDKVLIKINDIIYLFLPKGKSCSMNILHMSHVVIYFDPDFSLYEPIKNRTETEIKAKSLMELIPNHPKLKIMMMEEALG